MLCCNIFKVMLMNSHLQVSLVTSQHMVLHQKEEGEEGLSLKCSILYSAYSYDLHEIL